MAAPVAPPAHLREAVFLQLAAEPDASVGKSGTPVVQMRPIKRTIPVAMRYVAAASGSAAGRKRWIKLLLLQ